MIAGDETLPAHGVTAPVARLSAELLVVGGHGGVGVSGGGEAVGVGQGHGVGRQALAAAVEEARALGARTVADRYLDGSRLRLREVLAGDGTVTRKLGQKIRLSANPLETACTSIYLDDAWLEVIREVTADEAWTGGGLAR